MFKKSFIIIILIFNSLLFAGELSLKEVFYKDIALHSKENNTISSDFIQSKKLKNIKKLIVQKGSFYYDNSGKIAMYYDDGNRMLMLEDKFFLTQRGDITKISAKENPFLEQIFYMLRACMSGDISKFGRGWNFYIIMENGFYNVELRPKNSSISKYIYSIKMIFEKDSLTLEDLTLTEAKGSSTNYKFLNKKINAKIDKSIFEE